MMRTEKYMWKGGSALLIVLTSLFFKSEGAETRLNKTIMSSKTIRGILLSGRVLIS